MTKKSNMKIIFVTVVALIIVGAIFGIASLSGNTGLPTAKLPFNVRNYTSISALFNPLTGLDVTGTPAPAISCSLTNNGHLLGTDGSDFKVDTATGMFSPTYQSLVVPYNGATLSSVKIIVYLYCNTSPLASYNYYPYLTGGTVTMQFKGRDATQTLQVTQAAQTQQVSPANVNGISIPIATFTIPASSINSAVGQQVNDYYSQQLATLTGTLTFKQGTQSYQQTATYNIQPLYTAYSFLVKGTGQQAQSKPTSYVAPICTNAQFQSGYTIQSGQCVAPGQQPPNTVFCVDGSPAPNGQLSQCSTPSTPNTCSPPNVQTQFGCLPQTPPPGNTPNNPNSQNNPNSPNSPQIPNLPVPPLDINSGISTLQSYAGWIILLVVVIIGAKIAQSIFGKKKGGLTLTE